MKQLAIMKDVGFGCRDIGRPILWFNTYISNSECALQIISYQDAEEIIKKYHVNDVHDLEGKPCWVDAGNGMIKFLEPAII